MKKKNKKVACYLRLSKEEEGKSESSSISEQKKLLTKYCIDNNIFNYIFFIDDGYSGSTFNRPAFNDMKKMIEAKEIECVITKDLSRLGRDYISVGFFTEIFFPNNEVRYIAVNDGIDSENNRGISDDFSPFINIMNEQYLKDTSMRIRSVMEAKALKGEHLTGLAPYGYKKSESDNKRLVIDEEVRDVIMFIFEQSASGHGSGAIRDMLKDKKVLTPSAYKRSKSDGKPQAYSENEDKRYDWSTIMILRMLKNKIYIGTKVYYKDRKATHKSNRLVQSKDKWIEVENSHDPIVSEELFYKIQELLASKSNVKVKDKRKKVIENIFKGKVKCGVCGWNMQVTEVKIRTTGGRVIGTKKYLFCGRKGVYGEEVCSGNRIGYDDLVEVVLKNIK